MFQIDKFSVLKNDAEEQTGIKIAFVSGQSVQVNFSEIPAGATTVEAKAAWLKERLNELLVVGTKPDGSPIRHYKANVVGLSDNPLAVAVSVEAT